MEIIYARINPKKNPKIVSKLPIPVYLIALLIPLLINNIKKITIIKIVIPSPTSSTYSLSIIFLTYGFNLGVSGAPETYLLREDKILQKHIGIMSEKVWKDKFIPLLDK